MLNPLIITFGNFILFNVVNVSGCGCKKLKDQEILLSLLGMTTHKFDDIGQFTYCLHQADDAASFTPCCSVVVQRNVKVSI